MFLIHSSKENAYIHTSETGVGGMLNRKERPCCILLRISILAHIKNQQNPTYIFLLSFVLLHPYHGFHKVHLIFRRTNVTCEPLCFATLIMLCIAFCILQPRSRFVLVAIYNCDRNGMLQATLMYSSNNKKKKRRKSKCGIFFLKFK